MPRLFPTLAPLFATTTLLLNGCGGTGTTSAQNTPAPAPSQAKGQQPQQKPGQGPGELTTPNTRIDLDKAEPIVKNEVKGGEDAKGPTPMAFLYQAPDLKAIHDEPFELATPKGFQGVASFIPTANPMTKGKVELGKQLYFDPRISLDATISCASCHDPAKGWTDNARTSVGINGQKGGRNAPTVLNTIYGRTMFWDGRAPSLEGQAQGPIQNKIEMGDQSYKQIVERLRSISGYKEQFLKVFGTDVTLDGMAKAIAAFERTAISADSPYDQYANGDPIDQPETLARLTESQKRGMALFGLAPKDEDPYKVDKALVKKANCTACHAGFNFTDEMFHNLGVGFDPTKGKLADLGRFEITPIGSKNPAELGAFKTPTIRDIARTGPYMHDGSEKTLAEVVEFYNKGGTKNPTLDPDMKPLNLTDGEKADLVAFMQALTSPKVEVKLPTLPPGPDGKSPDPRSALGSDPTKTASEIRGVHRLVDRR